MSTIVEQALIRPESASPDPAAAADTGRIRRGVGPTARRILFTTGDTEMAEALALMTEVDRAHLVMLVERGLVDADCGRALLGAIAELRGTGYAALRGREAARGLYLLYEGWLMERLGPDTGGVLQTGRSRNDLGATTLRIKLRAPVRGLLREGLRLQAVLLRRARRYAGATMPAYTHLQPAVPITYGHYLAGVALALSGDLRALLDAARELDRCPLGAGAVGGTSLPIDPRRTAALLGFRGAIPNSVDAVGSRNLVLRLLSAAAVLGVTLSRLATDLLHWSTAESGLLRLPDDVVGSSSMMPQKRNAFLLEHVQGRGAHALGALVSAAGAMHAKPFTNHIAVGTEGVAPVGEALRRTTEAATLARLVVARAEPDRAAMLRRADEGHTTATELANRLVVIAGMPFRAAHHRVGEAVTQAEALGIPLAEAARRMWGDDECARLLDGLDAASVAAASGHGGGPGAESIADCWREVHAEWTALRARCRALDRRWAAAAAELDRAAAAV